MQKCVKSFFIVILFIMVGQFLMAAPSGQRLRDLADRIDLLFGYASKSNFNSLPDASQYVEAAKTEFNFLTCENAMKADALQPSKGNFNFGPADVHVQFAQENNMEIHGHTLVWHSQAPSWMRSISNKSQLIDAMNTHIDTVLNHYKGKILVWDVVNEAFNEDGSFRRSFWYNVIGEEYIDLAFKRASQADPDTKLVYNDYNLAMLGSKSDGAYRMIKSMIERGIPIDGVGFQMHLTNATFNTTSFASNIARFADLGLEVYITELDIRVPSNPSQNDLNKQAENYRAVFETALANPAVKAIQVWGITDKYSWVPSVFGGTDDALLFDRSYNAKPAYYAVQDVLANIPIVDKQIGNVNGDDLINILDALMIAQHSVGLTHPSFNPANADVNCDGMINIIDALIIAQYSVGLIGSFSC